MATIIVEVGSDTDMQRSVYSIICHGTHTCTAVTNTKELYIVTMCLFMLQWLLVFTNHYDLVLGYLLKMLELVQSRYRMYYGHWSVGHHYQL